MILNVDGEDWVVVKDCGRQASTRHRFTYVVAPLDSKPGDPDEYRVAVMHHGAFRMWLDLEVGPDVSGSQELEAIDREVDILMELMGEPE